MDKTHQLSTLLKYRNKMYQFLSRVYEREVDQTFLEQLRRFDFTLGVANHELKESYQSIADYLKSPNDNLISDLSVDFAKIFLAAGIAQGDGAFPYESVYMGSQKFIMQDSWEEVRSFYQKHGWKRNHNAKELLEDHISLEFEFMALLGQQMIENPQNEAVLSAQAEFLEQHLGKWIAKFCADVEKTAETPFYKSMARVTQYFVAMDHRILENQLMKEKCLEHNWNSGFYTYDEMDQMILNLQNEYKIYAPKRLKKRDAKNEKDFIRYGEISSSKEIVFDMKSDFSPKEVYYPISQCTMFFRGPDCVESPIDHEKEILIFARPCDINSIKRLDQIFLTNGGQADLYYKRKRDKVKFVLMECTEGFEECFCVSMNSNKTDDYAFAVRFAKEGMQVHIKDSRMVNYFEGGEKSEFYPSFIQSNQKSIIIPDIKNNDQLKDVMGLEFWKEYNDQCIGCGGCNTVCGTCSCFDTVDIRYHETSTDGERRRVWSSCMLDSYTMTAGGGKFRKTHGDNMRFKVLHKMYDYRLRFGGSNHMCVGCGRCDVRCPKDISFFDAVIRLQKECSKSADTKLAEKGEQSLG